MFPFVRGKSVIIRGILVKFNFHRLIFMDLKRLLNKYVIDTHYRVNNTNCKKQDVETSRNLTAVYEQKPKKNRLYANQFFI